MLTTVNSADLIPGNVDLTMLFQPSDTSVNVTAGGTLYAWPFGRPVPTVQWQQSDDAGDTWTDVVDGNAIAGASTPTLTILDSSYTWNGFLFRAVFTNKCESLTSSSSLLTVVPGYLQQQAVGDDTFGFAAKTLPLVDAATAGDGLVNA